MQTTPRLGLRVPDGTGDAPDVPLWMLRLAQDVESSFLVGLLADRPPPGKQGRRFVALDERTDYVDTGTAWVLASKAVTRVAHGWALMLPLTVGTIPGFFHSQGDGETRKLVKLRGRLFGGNATATVQVRRNGMSFKTLSLTSAAQSFALAAGEIQTLAEDDYIDLNLTTQANTTGMVLTVFEAAA